VARAAADSTSVNTHGFARILTSFVGRTAETAELAGLLEDYRLLTVTGPGGVGKSRLAGEVAGRVAERFADGAWLVELASVEDPAQVPGAVMTAFGLHSERDAPAAGQLAAALALRQLLLVLDNCEHVLPAVAALCGDLLQSADDVRILATSREPIGIAGEIRYRLEPLGLPSPGEAPGQLNSDAARLFADRACWADRHFEISKESSPDVARIVARLDGMPLAIELAAARVEALGVRQLADRLDAELELLADADRLAPARQRPLTATAEWSYRLLTGTEQRVFSRLTIFPAHFSADAAVAVAGQDASAAVLRLVDCSLVTPPVVGPDGRARYRMLETLRAYGLHQLALAGEGEDAAARLAEHAVSVAEQATAQLKASGHELAGLRWLDAEDAAVHTVLNWALANQPGTALRLALALAPCGLLPCVTPSPSADRRLCWYEH
jgi:predicted ATPase